MHHIDFNEKTSIADHDIKNTNLDPQNQDFNGSILNRLEALKGNRSNKQIALDWGIKTTTVHNYFKNGSLPNLERASIISKAESISMDWLVNGIETKNVQKTTIPDTVEVTEYDIEVSAGYGNFDCEESRVGTFAFPKRWLREQGLSGIRLCAIRASGDSMRPAIHDGDTLLVKILDTPGNAAFDSICILRLDDMLFVKRVRYDMERRGHHVISDNPLYSSTFIPNEEYAIRLEILGVVTGTLYKKASDNSSEDHSNSLESFSRLLPTKSAD